jgi:signal peptidase II
MKKGYLIFMVSSIVVLLDYITKRVIEAYVQPQEAIKVLPFLRIVNTKNPGAAFGILSNLSNNVFILISIIAIILLIIYLLRTTNRLEILSISLILGGATGNLIDRITIGKVIDFIDFFVDRWHWPAFNVADSALSVGIIIFLWANVRHWRHRDKVESKR